MQQSGDKCRTGSISKAGRTSLRWIMIEVAWAHVAAQGPEASRYQRLGVDSERLDFVSRISENEDIDLPKSIMELQAAQMAYQASLGAASKVMQTSLLDFLR